MNAAGSKWRNVEGWKESARSFGCGLVRAAGLIALYLAMVLAASWFLACSASTTAARSQDGLADARELLDTLWEVEATRQAVLVAAQHKLDAGELSPAGHEAIFALGEDIYAAWTEASGKFDRYTTVGGVSAKDLRKARDGLRSQAATLLVVAKSHGIVELAWPAWARSRRLEVTP